MSGHPAADTRVAERVRELAADYEPPRFEEAPGPDAALFLTAIDHRSGYKRPHEVEGEGPFEGSELIWRLGILAERRDPGLVSAARLRDVDAAAVEEIFRAGGETVAGAAGRAELWTWPPGWTRITRAPPRGCCMRPQAGSADLMACSPASPGSKPSATRSRRRRSFSRRSASAAAGWRWATPRAGRCAPTTC